MMAHVSNKYMDDSDFEVELEEDEEVLNSQVCIYVLLNYSVILQLDRVYGVSARTQFFLTVLCFISLKISPNN